MHIFLLPLDSGSFEVLKRGDVLCSSLDHCPSLDLLEQAIRILEDSALQAFRLQRLVHLIFVHPLSNFMHLIVDGSLRRVLLVAFKHLLLWAAVDPITALLSSQKRLWCQYGVLGRDL